MPLDLNDAPPQDEGRAATASLPPWVHRRAITADDAIAQFRAAAEARGIILPAEIVADGKIHRCDTAGRNGENDAAYLFHPDRLPAGGFENHQDGRGWENWRADTGSALSVADAVELRRKAEAARVEREANEAQRHAETAAKTAHIWSEAEEHPDHPYLARRGARRQRNSNSLVVPARDIDGELHSLQFIDAAGNKRFLTGGRIAGCFFTIGALADGDAILIAEGFATGASAHQATSHAVVMAFDASNLAPVAKTVRAKYPNSRIAILADDDWRTTGNPGLTKAREAAAAIGAIVTVPIFGPNRPENASDFNDLHEIAGLDAVKR